MAAESWSQSPPGMHTRSLTRQAAEQVGAGTDASAPGGTNQDQGGGSSVTVNQTQPSADISLSATNLNIESDPVVSANDKRIKHLVAQTCMQKLMLDSHIKELVKQANGHKD